MGLILSGKSGNFFFPIELSSRQFLEFRNG